MKSKLLRAGLVAVALASSITSSFAQAKKPNILVIFGDDIGQTNVSAYSMGLMGYRTPNIDRIAKEGMMFTDYYAEQSCTAGRSSFITGQCTLRTGLSKVGVPGSPIGLQDRDVAMAQLLKAQGYATGQFGKNHLGALNKSLPIVHGFDEFFGYLSHLDAMSDPYWYSFPVDETYYNTYGLRSLIHSFATDTDDPTEMSRWGRVGKQRIVDEGPLPLFPDMSNVPNMHDLPFLKAKYDMTTFDEVLVRASSDFMDKAKRDGKPFFVWHNTTRMHVWTFLSKRYSAMQNSETNYGLEEAGMAQLDDSVGALLKKLDDMGEANNTIVIFTTHNGAEVFTWPDGGMTPLKNTKGTVGEGGFRVPAIIRWPGQIKPGTVENGIFSGLDWFPTIMAAAGNPNITDQLLKGVKLGDRSYKNHLDGYNQLALLEGKGPSARHELFYFGGPHLGAVRLEDFKFTFFQQPQGWPGAKVTTDMPTMVNLRQEPFERTPTLNNESLNNGGFGYVNDFMAHAFLRFVLVQQEVAKLAMTAIDYPPMQAAATFNLDAVKKEIEVKMKEHEGQ